MVENQPLISIIMPAYNSEKYISEAIESVCNQSYKNWELLVVNDGSTDQTPKIIADCSKKDFRIKIFHRKNEGVSMARNFALNLVCGDFVTFLDSDDVYHVDRLKKMVTVFQHYVNCDIVFARHKEFRGQLEKNETVDSKSPIIFDDDILKETISDISNHYMCNVMIKTEIAKREKFASIRFSEDFFYIRDCVCRCKQIAVLDEILYFYRRDNENAMTSHFFSETYVIDYMKLVENTYTFCKKHELKDEFYKNMVAHEYAHSSMRVRKCTSYSKFVTCMNNSRFREGIEFANASQCTLFEKILFFMVKHKIYMPYAFWIW